MEHYGGQNTVFVRKHVSKYKVDICNMEGQSTVFKRKHIKLLELKIKTYR